MIHADTRRILYVEQFYKKVYKNAFSILFAIVTFKLLTEGNRLEILENLIDPQILKTSPIVTVPSIQISSSNFEVQTPQIQTPTIHVFNPGKFHFDEISDFHVNFTRDSETKEPFCFETAKLEAGKHRLKNDVLNRDLPTCGI